LGVKEPIFGRLFDTECGVRYGIISEPVPIKKAKDGK
jgi:hypothetical protein